MVLRGHIEYGMIVLDDPQALPEGAEVEVIVSAPKSAEESNGETVGATLHERLKAFVGKLDGLPPDASINHDHYLYGTPKKSP
jgi:hypothetical protein